MSDRGLPSVDGSSACPFVAFEDDRDERADRPDHRHRCFAEAVPAPRALAHQEAYCLSSAFPVCPTFQDWARREAAQARSGRAGGADSATAAAASAAGAAAFAGDGDESPEGDEREVDVWGAPRDVPAEERPRRNPPRDWAAPPPWAAGSAAAGAAAMGSTTGPGGQRGDDPAHDAAVPEEGRGLAGSAADRLASGEDPDRAWAGHATPRPRSAGTEPPAGPSAPPDPELAGLVGRREVSRIPADLDDAVEPRARPTRRPTVSSTRDRSRDRDRDRERVADERGQHDGPSWERVRRYEAYPSIKARAGLPGAPQLPRMTVLVGALVVAALLLFLLPTILNIGGRVAAPGASVASPTGVAASASLEPTPVPVPTPHIYTIKAGDALGRIARQFGLTLEQLLAANEDIKDPNRIQVGQKIVIPTPPPDEVSGESPSASPAASP